MKITEYSFLIGYDEYYLNKDTSQNIIEEDISQVVLVIIVSDSRHGFNKLLVDYFSSSVCTIFYYLFLKKEK